MNWYLLNIPLAVTIVTAVVVPILVVISREHRAEQPTDLSTVPLRVADRTLDAKVDVAASTSTGFANAPIGVLETVS